MFGIVIRPFGPYRSVVMGFGRARVARLGFATGVGVILRRER